MRVKVLNPMRANCYELDFLEEAYDLPLVDEILVFT